MPKDTVNHDIEALDTVMALPDQPEQSNTLELSTTLQSVRKWNRPRGNILRLASTYLCFFLLGCNDSSYGFLLPHLEDFYHVQYATVSLLFLSPVAGFIVSTLCNYPMHLWIGQRGVALVAGTCHIIAYSVACVHPPFPVLVVAYVLVGLGSGAKTAAWNTFVSGLDNANEVLGLLHGFYGIGATLTPSVGSLLVTKRGWQWYEIYYLLVGLSLLDIVFSYSSFKQSSGKVYREKVGADSSIPLSSPSTEDDQPNRTVVNRTILFFTKLKNSQTIKCLRHKVVWRCSAYLLAYVGSEVALGGWLVTFMVRVRGGTLFSSGIVASGFWAGITVGRITLGFVTGRWFKNEMIAVALYLVLAVTLELLFWQIPNFLASAITVSLLGFFLGPLFPGVIVCVTKQIPKSERLASIGIISAIGASGASVVPFIVGAIAQARGVQVLQPIILACLCLCFLIWITLPGFRK